MATVQINRDPFSRASLMRTRLDDNEHFGHQITCAWCGQPARFRYRWEADRLSTIHRFDSWSNPFCSVDCYRSYAL